jgi:dienelactone hydrolase
MRNRTVIITAVIAVALAALAGINLLLAGRGVIREQRSAGTLPIEIFRPAEDSSAQRPAVIVAHGFSGNRQLMYAFGHFLARNGYVAALIDFDGHGANPTRMPDGFGDAQYRALAANLDTARLEAASLPYVDPARIALLGHSMGAGTVARYAAEHPDVPASIAISLGNFGQQLPERADMPRNLLVLVGAAEFGGFVDGSTAALQRAYPGASAGATYGTFAGGTARRLVLVPNVEHITILFSATTQREVITWLDAAFLPALKRADVTIDARMGWLLLLYLAGAIGFYPLATALFGAQPRPALPLATSADTRRAVLIALAATAAAPLALLIVPYRWLPVTVANYVGLFFLLCGLTTLAGLLLLRAPLRPRVDRRSIGAALLLAVYALLVFNLPAQFVWNNALLRGDRLWAAPILFACCFVFFWADEHLALRVKQRGVYVFVARALVIASLVLAVVKLSAPGFLLLIVPLLPVLFVWHALYALWLRRLTGQAWVSALVNAAAFAWMMAATFAVID